PTALCFILTELSGKSIQEIKDYFDGEHNTKIDEYFDFLVAKDYGFYTNEPKNFPRIDLENWPYKGQITNAIIDFDKDSNHNVADIVEQLSSVFCEAVELRFFSKIRSEERRV